MFFSEVIRKVNNFLMKNLTIVLVIFVLLFVFMGLKSGNCVDTGKGNMPTAAADYEASYMMADSVAPTNAKMRVASTGGVIANSSSSVSNDKKIVKTYSLSIETKNVENSSEKVNSIVESLGGQTDNFYSYDYGSGLSYSYNIMIPSNRLDEAIGLFKKLGTLKSEGSSIQDMTEQYTDNESRLQNLKVRRDRLRKMMDTKTDKLADVLAVDRELSEVQYQIENYEKRNKIIDRDVSYSRVSLTLIPEPKVENFSGPKWKLSNSWNNAVNRLVEFGRIVVDYSFVAVVFLPIIILIFAIVFAIKKIAVKIKRK